MALYRFVERPLEFLVEHPWCDRVTVRLAPWAFRVTSTGQSPGSCSLFEGERLVLLIAARLVGLDDGAPGGEHPAAPVPVVRREAHAISHDVGLQRLRLLAQVDPSVSEIQMVAQRLAGRVPSLAQEEALYREPYILRDILTYRGAAIAFAFLQSDLWRSPGTMHGSGAGEGGANGGDIALRQPAPCAELPVSVLIDAMANWRGLFSPDGRPYRSLNRTLMNLPGDVPPELVCLLNRIRLERPVVHPLELTAILLYAGAAAEVLPNTRRERFRTLHHATATEIGEAMTRIGTYTRRALHPGRPEDVRFAVRYFCDYPEPYHGPLAGLVERTIRWHDAAHERRRLEDVVVRMGGRDRPTAPPPIPLPVIPGVTFLATVGAVVAEGARMKHCIATRARDAVAGNCYLFHVEHQCTHASIEVSPDGLIRDAEGPGNTANAAVHWGAAQLGAWGAALAPRPTAAPCPVAPRPPAPRNRRPRRRPPPPDPNQLQLQF